MGGRRKTARGKRRRAAATRAAAEKPQHPSAPRPAPPRQPARRTRGALALTLAAGVAVQIATMAAGKIHWNSDQAIVGLMARHILTGQEHPTFYYGSHYAGTLEPHYLASLFGVFGASFTSYRLGMVLLLLLHSGLVYALARHVFGDRAALVSVAYLALPPFFFLYKGLTSDGAYTSLAVLGAGMLYAAVRLEEAEREGPKRAVTGWILLLGILAGLAWWLIPLAAYFYLAILAWFLLVRRSVFARLAHYAVFLGAFLLGSLPWWLANVGKGWPSLSAPGISRLRAGRFVAGPLAFFFEGVPSLFGARPGAVHPDIFTGASVVAFLIYVLPLAAALSILVAAKKRGAEPADRALLLMVLMLFSIPLVAGFNEDTYKFDMRYVYPVYAPFALLLGFVFCRTRWSRWTGVAAASAILLFDLTSIVRAPRVQAALSQPSGAALDEVVRALRERNIHEAYASYWMAYSLAFQSREEIAVASFGLGTDGTVRWPGYLARVAASSNPAFVLWGAEAARFSDYLRRRGAESAKSTEVGGYRIFWDVPAGVREEMAVLRHVPESTAGP